MNSDSEGCWGFFLASTLFSSRTIYILLLIFSPDILENILEYREYFDHAEAKNRSKVPKVAPKPAQNLQNLKSSVGIDPKNLLSTVVEGGNSCFDLVKTVLDAAAVTSNTKVR